MAEMSGSRVAFCGHCGNRTPQKLVHVTHFDATAWKSMPDGAVTAEEGFVGAHFVAICGTCQKALVYQDFDVAHAALDFATAELEWPDAGELHYSVPEAIALIYEEAARIAKVAPNAYAVQIRRALEALCSDRGIKQRSLAAGVGELASRGEIPPKLAELTDALRLLGNVGAHSTDQAITEPDVWVIDDFFKAVVEYVYVAPRKLAEFRERLKSLTR